MAKQKFYLDYAEADNYQVKVIEQVFDKPIIVTGCAGSGKSILALWKAKQIQDYRRGSFLYIVFTKALMQYMSDGIAEIKLNKDSVDYFNNWKKKGYPAADYIIVDEAQDFTREDIFRFARRAKKAVFFYGDSAQQLYEFDPDRAPVDMDEIEEITGSEVMELCLNHRLPKKIARLANYISMQSSKKFDQDFERRCLKDSDVMPKIIKCNGLTDQYDKIIEFIRNKRLTDVGILFRHNKQVKKAYLYFQDHGIDVEAKYDISRNNKVMDLDFKTDNPKMMTYHSAKGLQFEYVILPDCTDDDAEDVIPLYVAMTRSYRGLIITHSGNLSRLFGGVPNSVYETSFVSAPSKKKLSF